MAKMTPRAEAARSRAARHQPLRLLQLPRHQGLREGAVDRHRPVGRGQQAGHASRLRVHHRHPAHVEAGVVRAQAARPAHLRQGPRAAAAREAAHAELRLHRRRSQAAADGDHELPARDPAAGGDAGAVGARTTTSASGRTLVHRRNCVGCHIIEGDGGDFVKLVADPSLGPPMLTPEGARVQPDWLYAFLRGPITIRPWLNVRMPTFGLDDQNVNQVISYFGVDLELDRAVPDARDRDDVGERPTRRQAAVRAAEVPAVPRARRDSRRISRRRTSRPICGWRRSACSPTGSCSG